MKNDDIIAISVPRGATEEYFRIFYGVEDNLPFVQPGRSPSQTTEGSAEQSNDKQSDGISPTGTGGGRQAE